MPRKDTRDLTGARWSSTVLCWRQPFYQVVAPEAAKPFTPREEKRLKRGQRIGEMIADEVADEFRADGQRVQRELAVEWPAGWLHLDIYLMRLRAVVEVHSNAGAELYEHKVLQAAGGAIFHPRAQAAVVRAVDPLTNDDIDYGVNVEHFRSKVTDISNTVVAAIASGNPPPRACAHPGEAYGRFCRFAGICFEGWERPEPDTALDDPETRKLVLELHRVKQKRYAGHVDDGVLEQRQKAIQKLLEPRFEVGVTEVGRFTVRRTQVSGRRSLSIPKLEKAGQALPEHLWSFVKASPGYTVWDVEEVERP